MRFRKRVMSAVMLTLMLCALSVSSVLADDKNMQQENRNQVQILFLQDLHSRMEPYKDADSKTIGGISRLKTAIDEKKSENPSTFVFDAGDFSMGTLYQTIFESEASELTMLGRIGVEATTFGNHEFDYRSEGVSNMLHSAIRNAEEDETLKLPQFLVSNIDWEKNQTEENKLVQTALEDYGSTEYTVIEHGGVRVGVFGVMGEDSVACAPLCGIEFDGIVESSKRIVEQLKNENVDMIVCLSHSGTNPDPDKSEDEMLAKEVPEIDVIISGHSHITLEEPVICGDTVIASSGCYGEKLGELQLVRAENGRWKLAEYVLNPMDETVEKDPEIEQYLSEYREKIDSEYLTRYGYTMDQVLAENDITFSQMEDIQTEIHEDTLGNLITDAYIYAIKEAEGDAYETVDVAIVPTGVIRDTFQKGEVTVSDAFNVSALGIGADGLTGYPLVSVYLTGAELRTIAEVDASISPMMTTAQLFSSGMKWEYNPNRLILNRVTDIGLATDFIGVETPVSYDQTETVENEKLYRVVSGLYSAQMLGAVNDQSKGILSITPKNKDGEVIEDFEQYIIHDRQGNEVKEWYALASYIDSFSENEDGVSVIPERYSATEGRKVKNDSKNIVELLKNPNKIAWIVYGIVVVLVVVIALLVRFVCKKVKQKKKRG